MSYVEMFIVYPIFHFDPNLSKEDQIAAIHEFVDSNKELCIQNSMEELTYLKSHGYKLI